MKRTRTLEIVLFLIGLAFFSWVAWSSTRIAGGEDGVQHHLIAKYVPQHPTNLLDHWGKPLFTLLSAPFAQFGFFGSQLFNILCALFAAWLTYKTSAFLGFKRPWLSAILLLFSTMYFYTVPSAVTEILFSTVLIGGVYALSRKRPSLAAAIISFLPFARTEGNIIIFMFALGLLALRHYKSIPWLGFGFILYSVVGYFHFGDWLWVIHQNPYGDARSIYGTGSFWHYVRDTKSIWGNPLFALWVLGSILFTIRLGRNLVRRNKLSREQQIMLWVVFGSFYAYLFGHSYVWWKGLSGSLGLKRVMAGTMPLAALIGNYAWHEVVEAFNPRLKALRLALTGLMAFIVIAACFELNPVPYHGDREREHILEAGKWYRNSEFNTEGERIYYFAPSAAQAFEVDPFDPEQRGDLSSLPPEGQIEPKALVVWDAHFGPNECHLPLDSLKSRSDLKIIHHTQPQDSFTTLNQYNYEIYLFRSTTP